MPKTSPQCSHLGGDSEKNHRNCHTIHPHSAALGSLDKIRKMKSFIVFQTHSKRSMNINCAVTHYTICLVGKINRTLCISVWMALFIQWTDENFLPELAPTGFLKSIVRGQISGYPDRRRTDWRRRMRRRQTIRAGRRGRRGWGQSPFDEVLWRCWHRRRRGGSHQVWLVYLFHATSNDPPHSSVRSGGARAPPLPPRAQSHDCCCPCCHQTTYRLLRFYLPPTVASASIRPSSRQPALIAPSVAEKRLPVA